MHPFPGQNAAHQTPSPTLPNWEEKAELTPTQRLTQRPTVKPVSMPTSPPTAHPSKAPTPRPCVDLKPQQCKHWKEAGACTSLTSPQATLELYRQCRASCDPACAHNPVQERRIRELAKGLLPGGYDALKSVTRPQLAIKSTSVPTAEAATSPGACVDLDPTCSVWAQGGACTSSSRAQLLRTCRKSCDPACF
jgi:hypothetical protein